MRPLGKQHAWMFGLGLSTAFNGKRFRMVYPVLIMSLGILGLAAPIVFGMMTEHFGGNVEVLYTAALMVLLSAVLTFAIVPLTKKEPSFPKIPDHPVDDKPGAELSTIEGASLLDKEK